MLQWIQDNWLLISGVVTALVGLFVLIAKFTPNKTDDAVADAISKGWDFLKSIGGRKPSSDSESKESSDLFGARSDDKDDDGGPFRTR